MAVLGGGALSYERGNPISPERLCSESSSPKLLSCFLKPLEVSLKPQALEFLLKPQDLEVSHRRGTPVSPALKSTLARESFW